MTSTPATPKPAPRPTPSKPIPAPRPTETKPIPAPSTDPKPKKGAKREFVPKEHLTQRPFRNLKSMLHDGVYLQEAK